MNLTKLTATTIITVSLALPSGTAFSQAKEETVDQNLDRAEQNLDRAGENLEDAPRKVTPRENQPHSRGR